MYLQRNISLIAERYLKNFPIVCILGARQVGKTELSKHLGDKWDYFDLEQPLDLDLILRSPEVFFEQYSKNVIFDEAQEYPQLFKYLRGIVDRQRDLKGRFIVTGSSSPELQEQILETLAGRVGIIELDTLKVNEIHQQPLSEFYNIFNPEFEVIKENFKFAKPNLSNQQYRECWFSGGYPEPVLSKDPTFYQDWMHNYYATYINRDIAKLFPKINKVNFQKFISLLAGLSGTILNKSDISRNLETSERIISDYLYIAEHTYLWRNIQYDSNSQVKSIVKKPKGFLRDSGLQHFLQKIVDMDHLLRHPNSGFSFESFVIEEIIKGVKSTGHNNISFQYYRTAKGAEVDLIINTPLRKIPIEVKISANVPKKSLLALEKYISDNKLDFGILICQSDRMMWVTDSILQLPVCYL